MAANWKHYVISLILLMVLDILWIGLYFKGPYGEQVQEIQGTELEMKPAFGAAAYAFMVLGLFGITIPNIDATTTETLMKTSAQYGSILGAVVYGTYAFTAGAIFTNFRFSIAMQDTVRSKIWSSSKILSFF